MKVKKRIRLNIQIIDILTILTFGVMLLDVPYINHLGYFRSFKVILFSLTLLLQILYAFTRRIVVFKGYLFLLINICWVFFVTVLKNGSIINFISDYGTIICVCLIIVFMRSRTEADRTFRIWCFLLFILLIVDLLTMFLYPEGLYTGTYIHNNWFLGYKTSRLTYTFTLLVLYSYLQIRNSGSLTIKSFIIDILVVVNTVMSQSTGAAIVIVLYVVMLVSLFGTKKTPKQYLRKYVLSLTSNYKLFLIVYIILDVLVVFLQYSPVIDQIVYGVFNKQYSFGERTLIWSNVLSYIKGNWLSGAGIQSDVKFTYITGGFNNAHNTLFSYLLTGGIVSAFLVLMILISAFKKTNVYTENYCITLYIYCILLLGITSSALAFSPFFFANMLIPINNQISNRKKIYGGSVKQKMTVRKNELHNK